MCSCSACVPYDADLNMLSEGDEIDLLSPNGIRRVQALGFNRHPEGWHVLVPSQLYGLKWPIYYPCNQVRRVDEPQP